MKGQMTSSRWFRKQKAGFVSDPMKDILWYGIPVCSYPTSNYGIKSVLRNKQKKN